MKVLKAKAVAQAAAFSLCPWRPNRAWAPQASAWVLPHFRLHRLSAAINQVGLFMSRQTKLLSDLPLKDPAQA